MYTVDMILLKCLCGKKSRNSSETTEPNRTKFSGVLGVHPMSVNKTFSSRPVWSAAHTAAANTFPDYSITLTRLVG